VVIENSQDFKGLQKAKPRPLILWGEHSPLILRAGVHKSRADLLMQIEGAIEPLRENGKK